MHHEFSIHAEVVDPLLVSKPAGKHFLCDCERHGNGFALVIRSDDKAVIGTTDKPDGCLLRFNDRQGRRRPFVVATAPDRAVLDTAAADLIAFYSAPATLTFGQRFNRLGSCARAVLPVVMAVFGIAPRNRNGWNVGSAKLLQPAKRDPIQVAARAFSNVDALNDAVANAAGSPQPREVVARVAEILHAVRAPKHVLVAA